MSRYHLSEAYASLYSPRLQEDFDDNLRFIDYMLDEDIEEVVESLFWEFRDYGHSIDEAIDLLRISASSEVINESLELLSEARYTARQMQDRAAFKAKQQADTQSTTRTKDAKIRQDQRKARVDGAISRVKAAWKGAAGGLGRAAKAVSSGVSKAGAFVSQQRQAAKAKLQKLIRTGSAKVERAKRDITGETGRTKAMRSRQRYDSNKERRAETAKSAVGNAFAAPEKKKPQAALPPARETQNPRRAAALAKIKKAAEGTASKGIAFSGPGGTSITQTAKAKQQTAMRAASGQKRAARKASTKQLNASYEALLDTIIEDLIYEGYANNEDDALNIINSLNEDTLQDITQEYLVD